MTISEIPSISPLENSPTTIRSCISHESDSRMNSVSLTRIKSPIMVHLDSTGITTIISISPVRPMVMFSTTMDNSPHSDSSIVVQYFCAMSDSERGSYNLVVPIVSSTTMVVLLPLTQIIDSLEHKMFLAMHSHFPI